MALCGIRLELWKENSTTEGARVKTRSGKKRRRGRPKHQMMNPGETSRDSGIKKSNEKEKISNTINNEAELVHFVSNESKSRVGNGKPQDREK